VVRDRHEKIRRRHFARQRRFTAGWKAAPSSMPTCGVHPYHGSGHRLEIYGKDGTLAMIGGGEGGGESAAQNHGRDTKTTRSCKELPVPDRFKWVPDAVRKDGPAYEVGQMWVKFAEGRYAPARTIRGRLRSRGAAPPNVGCHRARVADGTAAETCLTAVQSFNVQKFKVRFCCAHKGKSSSRCSKVAVVPVC
jgi:hypothetical protein